MATTPKKRPTRQQREADAGVCDEAATRAREMMPEDEGEKEAEVCEDLAAAIREGGR